MTKIYELPNEKRVMADVDEKHHTATVSVYILDDIVKAVNKTGYWIEVLDEEGFLDGNPMKLYHYECSECGCEDANLGKNKYCPNCGCRMVEPQESEEV